jgi:hypothetical protein
VKDELAAWSGGVDLFCQTDELNAALLKTLEQLDQMSQRAPCSIQFPYDKRIPWSHIRQRFVQSFSLRF